jgi:hypothetical protein
METLEISLRDVRSAYEIIDNTKPWKEFINWTSTSTLEVNDYEIALDIIDELERFGLEVECIY